MTVVSPQPPPPSEVRLTDVVRATGVPDLIEILADRLSEPELVAVLRDAYRRRAGRMTAPNVLAHYQRRAFFHPSPTAASILARIDRIAISIAAAQFEAVELAPICPAAAASALTPVDSGAAWGAGGGCEVVSDCRTALALEAAVRRRELLLEGSTAEQGVQLCASHRELHAPFSAPLRREYHHRVLGLCHAGNQARQYQFEITALIEQLSMQLLLLESLRTEGFRIGLVTVMLYHEPDPNLERVVRGEIASSLSAAFPEVRLLTESERRAGRGSFAPIGFTIVAEDQIEVEHTIGMGGFTDWTRRLLGRAEERLLVSQIATERIGEAFAPGSS